MTTESTDDQGRPGRGPRTTFGRAPDANTGGEPGRDSGGPGRDRGGTGSDRGGTVAIRASLVAILRSGRGPSRRRGLRHLRPISSPIPRTSSLNPLPAWSFTGCWPVPPAPSCSMTWATSWWTRTSAARPSMHSASSCDRVRCGPSQPPTSSTASSGVWTPTERDPPEPSRPTSHPLQPTDLSTAARSDVGHGPAS